MQRTTRQLVMAIVATMQILDAMAHDDDSHQRNIDTCAQLRDDAKKHQAAPEDQALIAQLAETLDMQIKRHTGEFHITGRAAAPIWQQGLAAGEAYLMRGEKIEEPALC